MMWGDGWGGWLAGLLMMALFWAGLAAAIYLVVRAMRGGSPPPSGRSRALDILAERFAKGEITAEEFEERRRVIESHAG